MISNEHNFMNLVESQLADLVKDELEERILNKLVSEFKENAREVVKEHVNKLSFDAVESMRDVSKLRDEIHMYLHYKDDESIEKSL